MAVADAGVPQREAASAAASRVSSTSSGGSAASAGAWGSVVTSRASPLVCRARGLDRRGPARRAGGGEQHQALVLDLGAAGDRRLRPRGPGTTASATPARAWVSRASRPYTATAHSPRPPTAPSRRATPPRWSASRHTSTASMPRRPGRPGRRLVGEAGRRPGRQPDPGPDPDPEGQAADDVDRVGLAEHRRRHRAEADDRQRPVAERPGQVGRRHQHHGGHHGEAQRRGRSRPCPATPAPTTPATGRPRPGHHGADAQGSSPPPSSVSRARA